MKKALFITAADRDAYFRETMESWKNVRGFSDWPVYIRLEPTGGLQSHIEIIEGLGLDNVQWQINPRVYGVLHHPWVGFEELFALEYDFVVRGEDDLPVADDILEYFDWAAEEYKDDKDIAIVLSFTGTGEGDPSLVRRTSGFNPWVWGTWKDRWEEFIGPTWDHDYSTYNGTPGNQSGWDWNLNTRILPQMGKSTVVPVVSRVQNIGVWGVHGTPANHFSVPNFNYHIDPVEYHER